MPRPPTKHLPLIRNLVLLGCAVVAAPPVERYFKAFASSDAFQDMRKDVVGTPPTYLMRLTGVRLKHYSATQLVTYAHCDSVDLASDRHSYELNGVHDALYRGKQGEFRYSADHATYIDALSQLTAHGTVRIHNKDMNLTATAMSCDGKSKQLKVPGRVRGTLRGGKLDAAHIDYDIDKGAYITGPVKWKGILATAAPEIREVEQVLRKLDQTGPPTPTQKPAAPTPESPKTAAGTTKPSADDADDKPTVWEIQGDTVDFTGNDTQIAHYTKAVATDGEIILIAPTVVHDRKTDVVTATGRIQYFSAKADIVADQCVIYRKEKRAVLTGNVLMYVKPKKDQDGKPKVEPLPPFQPLNPDQVTAQPPAKVTEEEKKKADQLRDGKSIREFPTVVVSEKTEYWYAKGARRAVITGSPQARQEMADKRWRHMWTNVGFYDGEKETLKMVSSKGHLDTRMKNSIGDDVTAEWMLVSTKEDDDAMSGHAFSGSLASLDNDEVPSDKSKPAKGKPTVTTPPVATPPVTTPPTTGGGKTGGPP